MSALFNAIQNSCFVVGCRRYPDSMCKCSSEFTYMCSKHMHKHVKKVKATHQIVEAKLTILETSEKLNSLIKIEKIILELNATRKNALNACHEIVENLNQCMKKFLSKIKSVKFSMIKVKQLIQINQAINSGFIEILKSADSLNISVRYEGIIKKISEVFPSDIQDNDTFILYSEDNDANLYTIDLNTLKKSFFGNFSKYWYCSAACKISANEYFITGGYSSKYKYHGNTSIIDMKNKTETVLALDTARHHHCCIFKENQVYVFGGHNGSATSHLVTKFDMDTKTWTSLANLPGASYHMYSTLINNRVIVTGCQLACVYILEQNNYLKNLVLDAKDYILCDRWLAGNNMLYECIDLGKVTWNKYSINFTVSHSSFYLAYKHLKYIYWVSYNGLLSRIDTERKVAELLAYN